MNTEEFVCLDWYRYSLTLLLFVSLSVSAIDYKSKTKSKTQKICSITLVKPVHAGRWWRRRRWSAAWRSATCPKGDKKCVRERDIHMSDEEREVENRCVLTLQQPQHPDVHRFRRYRFHPYRTRRCQCVVCGKRRSATIESIIYRYLSIEQVLEVESMNLGA